MALQVRERDSADQRWWSPERDITVIYPLAMRRVFHRLSNCFLAGHEDFNPDLLHFVVDSEIDDDHIAAVAKCYARLIKCVNSRKDTAEAVELLRTSCVYMQALIGALFLQEVTALFASKYGASLHKGEDDPNGLLLQELLDDLEAAQKSLPWRKRVWMRVRLMWATLNCRWSGSGS